VPPSFDKLQTASDALKRYMELDKPDHPAALDAFVTALFLSVEHVPIRVDFW